MSPQVKPAKVGGRKLEEIRDTDPDGRPVLHCQVIDPLARMLRAGTITDAMYNAARDFQAAFVIAQLEPLRALSMLRIQVRNGLRNSTNSNSMPGVGYKKRWTHWVGYPVRRALACGMWSEASAAFEIGRCASVGVADRCRKGMRRASWSRPSASWQPRPIHGAAGASRVDVVHRES